jgi:XTP/dITP diphosphohydrolase
MQTLIFATNNTNKIAEIKSVLNDNFSIITLKEAGIEIDIPEPHDTLEKNAGEKSWTIYRLTGKDCFSEDTGLEVAALNGAPGVKSARYAGNENDSKKNIAKLLEHLKGETNRAAQFRTVISLIIQGREYQFEGICKGEILEQEEGEQGFGYDAIFVPEAADKSFGEMNMEEKNKYSHRKKATAKLITFLKEHHG